MALLRSLPENATLADLRRTYFDLLEKLPPYGQRGLRAYDRRDRGVVLPCVKKFAPGREPGRAAPRRGRARERDAARRGGGAGGRGCPATAPCRRYAGFLVVSEVLGLARVYVRDGALACRVCHRLDYRSRHVHPAVARAAKRETIAELVDA